MRSLSASGSRQETGGAVASYPRATATAIGRERVAIGATVGTRVSAKAWLAPTASGTSTRNDSRRSERGAYSARWSVAECSDGSAWMKRVSFHVRDDASKRWCVDPMPERNATAATSAAMIRRRASARRGRNRETSDRWSTRVRLAMNPKSSTATSRREFRAIPERPRNVPAPMRPRQSNYSARNAVSGSTPIARRAGRVVATIAMAIIIAAAPPNTARLPAPTR